MRLLNIGLLTMALLYAFSSNGYADAPPIASFEVSASQNEDGLVIADAAASYDPDGAIQRYSWDFGDDVGGVGQNVRHVYANPGMYTITLVVVDDQGLSDMTSSHVFVRTAVDASSIGTSYRQAESPESTTANATDDSSGLSPGVLIAIAVGIALWLIRSRGNLKRMSPRRFEQHVADRFENDGWDTEVTPQSGDGGFDITLHRKGVHAIVECKKWTKPVGVDVVRKVYGVLKAGKASKAYVITTSRFTRGARDFAKAKRSLELVNGERLERWLDSSQILENVE